MITLSHEEVLLLKLLQQYFGSEQVIPNMSLSAVCGGKINASAAPMSAQSVEEWAKKVKCLFTVVDEYDIPKLVVEVEIARENGVLDAARFQHDELFRDVLSTHGIKHLRVSRNELDDLFSGDRSLTLYHVLKDRFINQGE